MRVLLLAFTLAWTVPGIGAGQIPGMPDETFSARAEGAAAGMAATELRIHIDRYTTDAEQQAAVTALETGGSAGLATAFRVTPATGYVEIGVRRWAIRYARQERTPNGRKIVIVLDQPVVFPGGGEPNLRLRDRFQLAVLQFEVDAAGTGQGTMAAAARIGRGGATGVELTDDSNEPIVLVAVTKIAS
jgi:hypothetical protein